MTQQKKIDQNRKGKEMRQITVYTQKFFIKVFIKVYIQWGQCLAHKTFGFPTLLLNGGQKRLGNALRSPFELFWLPRHFSYV